MRKIIYYSALFITIYVISLAYSFWALKIPIKDSLIAILIISIVATFVKFVVDSIFDSVKDFIKKSKEKDRIPPK